MAKTTYEIVNDHHQQIKEKMEPVGDKLIYTALFGSQNYDLDTETSDVDTHSMYIPHPQRIITNDMTHYPLIEGSFGYDGNSDVKTVHDMLEQFRKGNLNFLELLWTPYITVTPGWEYWVHYLRENRCVFLEDKHHLMTVWGGFLRQMIKRTTRADKYRMMNMSLSTHLSGYREDLGYNPKAFANALRIKETMIRFLDFDRDFGEALAMGSYADELKAVKQGAVPKAEVEQQLIDLDAWLQRFELKYDNMWHDHLQALAEKKAVPAVYPSNAMKLCTELEMDAFARYWRELDDSHSYLKNF